MRLVQIVHPEIGRRVALVQDDRLRLIDASCRSVHELATGALERSVGLLALTGDLLSGEVEPYDEVYSGHSEWKLLPAFDHPHEPSRCLVSGTGLTHRQSAEARHQIHHEGHQRAEEPTDSMRMYRWGLGGGRPGRGIIGTQPEWFYKGCGSILRAHNEFLEVPAFAQDGGEEAEVAGAYLIARDGTPFRVGLMQGNEFSDHVMESKNYLYLAPSKLRTCSLGPELLLDPDFQDVRGSVTIEREGQVLWHREIASGEANMCHSLPNLEHHHFKYPSHRRPGDAHVHFFGADALSFGDKVTLLDGDAMAIALRGFGRPLRNTIRVDPPMPAPVVVRSLA
jgi:hypothetical protein